MLQSTRSIAWVNVFLGLLTFMLGLHNAEKSWLGIVQTILGLLIIGQSLWALAGPSLTTILTWSILFGICGVWNVLVCILMSFSGLGIVVGGFGILQIYWAYRFYRKYEAYQQMTLIVPTVETTALHNNIWSSVTKANFLNDSDVQYRVNRRIWHGTLLPTMGIFATAGRQSLMLADKQDVTFTPKNPASSKGAVEGHLSIDSQKIPAVFDQISFQRYKHWKITV